MPRIRRKASLGRLRRRQMPVSAPAAPATARIGEVSCMSAAGRFAGRFGVWRRASVVLAMGYQTGGRPRGCSFCCSEVSPRRAGGASGRGRSVRAGTGRGVRAEARADVPGGLQGRGVLFNGCGYPAAVLCRRLAAAGQPVVGAGFSGETAAGRPGGWHGSAVR